MTLDEMYDQFELYGFEDFEESQKRALLNQAYLDIVTREPWPFMEKVVPFTIPSGTTQVTNQAFTGSPTDVDSVLSFVDITNDIVYCPERADIIEKNYRVNDISGDARFYYFVGEELFLFPQTSGSVEARLFYVQVPSEVDEDTDTSSNSVWLLPRRHHSAILMGALSKAYLVNDDPQAATFQALFEQRYQEMRRDIWMRQYDRPDRIHVVSDSYDWND